MTFQHTKEDLAEILRTMADYVEEHGPEQGYFEEIIRTGLYHDSIGKSIDYKDGVNYFVIDY